MKVSRERRKPGMGILEWFHLGDTEHVNKTIQHLKEIGISELRTGISWADYHTDEGKKWLSWLIPTLAEHVRILPCFHYTPPSVGLLPKTSSPPRRPEYYADFTHTILQLYGDYFDWVELWNEPNNTSEYDFRLDPDWSIFNKMISGAAGEAKKHGKNVLLGGMSPIDPGWLRHMYHIGLMKSIDAVGIHGFPGTFDSDWDGWDTVVEKTQDVIDTCGGDQKIWITEVGYSTWQQDEKKQIEEFVNVTEAPVERAYWYSLYDLHSKRPTVDGFHLDDREYHFGMVDESGMPKLLYRLLKEYGMEDLDRFSWITAPHITVPESEKSILITGGAGFIGTNLADRLLEEGKNVTIMDNLQRPGVETNLKWLSSRHRENLNIEIADVRNRYKVQSAVQNAEFIYHFAAQVAVTTSFELPYADLETNILGSMNVLEAIRNSSHRPPLLFTSTNKVYGNLANMDLLSNGDRYHLKQKKVNEDQKLDFHSPYGCSKGSADAYILDYARTYGLKTAVFRMSCIYGPHQFGTEDQGWVAHFLIQALKGKPITIFGDGKQVRDILYIDDLVRAFRIVYDQIDSIAGEEFNMGGGYENSVSLKEFIRIIEELTGDTVPCYYSDWRDGDQKYYVSDTAKFTSMTGWEPEHSISQGIGKLYKWLMAVNRGNGKKPETAMREIRVE
ncbi:MAG: NAD-dependent epimerase/dehydratase family protein [Balneolaceae bacterium]